MQLHPITQSPIIIDPLKCMSRKNKNSGIWEQCPHNPKFGCYCGKHGNNEGKLEGVLRIDQDLDTVLENKLKKKILAIETNNKQKILPIKQMIRLGKYSCQTLKTTLKHYGLKSTGNKKNMELELNKFYQTLVNYIPNEDKIISLQKKIKLYLHQKNIKLRGPALYERQLCNNAEDFYTFESILDLPNERFFSYQDTDNFIYGFEIKSFYKLLESKAINPYNRKEIPDVAITNFNNLMVQEKNKKIIEEKETEHLTEQQKFNDKVLTIFQHIEKLTSSVNIEWFLELDIERLKKFYRTLEDIWNYRAELNQTQKYNIVQDKDMFPVSVHNFFKIRSIAKIRNIILQEIEKLIFTAELDSDKTLACYYVLTALCDVNYHTRLAFPWLYHQ